MSDERLERALDELAQGLEMLGNAVINLVVSMVSEDELPEDYRPIKREGNVVPLFGSREDVPDEPDDAV